MGEAQTLGEARTLGKMQALGGPRPHDEAARPGSPPACD